MFREINFSDKKDVLRISSQIWEGDDYIAGVFDEWVKADDGLFTGYWVDNTLIGFGRMRFLTQSDIWLEALRKDPQTKINGVGNKIAQYCINQLMGKKIKSIRFATYFGNIPSIKLNEKLGFTKVLTLSLKELDISDYHINTVENNIMHNVEFESLHQYVIDSNYLYETKNFISKGWVVHQFTKELLEGFYSENNYAVNLKDGTIKGSILFCDAGYKDVCWISFIDAVNENIYKELLYFVINKALKTDCNKIQLLVPNMDHLNDFVVTSGFKSWEQESDVLLYEKPIKLIKQITGT